MGSSYSIWQMCEDVEGYTPVPYYHTGVSCGLPNEFGDVPPEETLVPSILLSNLKVYVIDAEGDSMEGARIFDGDPLLIEKTRHFEIGNIVLAMVDGQQMLKTYYVDDLGRHWLVPANKKYNPTLLTDEMDVRFLGRVKCNLRIPSDSLNDVRRSISEYLQKTSSREKTPRIPTREEVMEALLKVGPHIKMGRHWLGPCRVLMDCGYIPKERYDLFYEMVCYVLPEHKHLPSESELRRSAVGCFSKPFATWTDEKAPVHGKSYQGYYDAGEVMLKKLP